MQVSRTLCPAPVSARAARPTKVCLSPSAAHSVQTGTRRARKTHVISHLLHCCCIEAVHRCVCVAGTPLFGYVNVCGGAGLINSRGSRSTCCPATDTRCPRSSRAATNSRRRASLSTATDGQAARTASAGPEA